MFVLCLRILQSALVYVNTLMLQDVLTEPEWAGLLTPADRRGLTPLGALLCHLPASRDELLGAHAFAPRWRVPVVQHVGAAVQCEEVVRIRVFEGTQSKASSVQRGGGQRRPHVPSPDRWPINQTSDAGHSQRVFSAGWQNDVCAHRRDRAPHATAVLEAIPTSSCRRM
ncbi:hypothetical protein ABZY09_22060 [Streptomyces sp. NPDC002928]|uniref:hypothetical protein n=1 Tax=Streptomyces sp. NPDC002928 TaxID=3154440 RepID=UPI0033A852ED